MYRRILIMPDTPCQIRAFRWQGVGPKPIFEFSKFLTFNQDIFPSIRSFAKPFMCDIYYMSNFPQAGPFLRARFARADFEIFRNLMKKLERPTWPPFIFTKFEIGTISFVNL